MTSSINRPDQFMKALQIFMTLYDRATVNHVICFMHIIHEANKGNPVHMRKMPTNINVSQTTVNRVVRHLADRSYIHKNGLKFLKITTDPLDERFRIINLTPRGQLVAKQMMEAAYES